MTIEINELRNWIQFRKDYHAKLSYYDLTTGRPCIENDCLLAKNEVLDELCKFLDKFEEGAEDVK